MVAAASRAGTITLTVSSWVAASCELEPVTSSGRAAERPRVCLLVPLDDPVPLVAPGLLPARPRRLGVPRERARLAPRPRQVPLVVGLEEDAGAVPAHDLRRGPRACRHDRSSGRERL